MCLCQIATQWCTLAVIRLYWLSVGHHADGVRKWNALRQRNHHRQGFVGWIQHGRICEEVGIGRRVCCVTIWRCLMFCISTLLIRLFCLHFTDQTQPVSYRKLSENAKHAIVGRWKTIVVSWRNTGYILYQWQYCCCCPALHPMETLAVAQLQEAKWIGVIHSGMPQPPRIYIYWKLCERKQKRINLLIYTTWLLQWATLWLIWDRYHNNWG